jgi:tetratricopeptide (TPR) repeat protein
MGKIDIADKLLKLGKYQEAIKLYKEIHQAYPEEESVLLLLAWAHYDSGDTASAVGCLETLLQRELQRKVFTGFAFDELVRIYRQEKNFTKLIEICTNAVAVQPDDTGLLIELGNAYLQAGRADDACHIFQKLVNLENDNTEFYCRLGEALFTAGRADESENAYLQAVKIDPEQADNYYFKIADLFAAGGCYAEAERLLRMSISANQAKPLYHCCLGDVLIGQGKVREALVEYQTAAQGDNSGAGAYYNRLGNTLAKANYHREAVDAFRLALAIEPGNPVYTRHLALSYKALGLIDIA